MTATIDNCKSKYKQGDLIGALKSVEELLNQDPKNVEALRVKANILFLNGSRSSAIDCLNRANVACPNDKETLLTLGYQLLSPNGAENALKVFCEVMALFGAEADTMIGMGKALKLLNQHNEASMAFERALELLHPGIYLSPSVEEQLSSNPSLTIDKTYTFEKLVLSGDLRVGATLTGISVDEKFFIKIPVKVNPDKSNSLLEEFAIMSQLNRIGCVSCPIAHNFGVLAGEYLVPLLDDETQKALGDIDQREFKYLIQQYVPGSNSTPLPDVILAIIEQKACGIYHGDIRPDNIRFDPQSGYCYLIDYDQAIHLSYKVEQMGNRAFFDWVNDWSRKRYAKWNFPHFMTYFPGFDFDRDFWPLFKNDALNLAKTRLFSNQITTAAKHGIYHTIHERDIWIDGERDLVKRKPILDQIEFKPGERVLDVGCSSGILSLYLSARGCSVTGYELDPEVIRGAKIIANILSQNIEFKNVDLDKGEALETFDTVMLFSVIHHTKNMEENAARIAGACKRIIVECRLREGGMKPKDGKWESTSGWNYTDLESMYRGLESLFPGFRLFKNHGQGDRSRYLLEFRKANAAF